MRRWSCLAMTHDAQKKSFEFDGNKLHFVRRIRHPVRPVKNENNVRDRESGCEESEKDSMNSDALRPIRALLAPRNHYDNEDYGADEAIQGG